MSDKFDREQVRSFWEKQAVAHGDSPSASWSDHRVIEKEIDEITARLEDGNSVLDVGCANGFSSIQYAARRKIHLRGVDYVGEMIEQARARAERYSHELEGSVSFEAGDITGLNDPDGNYDKVIVTRVIINLGNWERQLVGLREAIRVLKPGGTLLLSEATVQGWTRLNQFRREWNLPEISMPPFNNYLDQDRVIDSVSAELTLRELVDFSSTYYVGTRVLKPLLIESLGAQIDVADAGMEWNRWFAALPAWGDYGVQRLFVFDKR